MCNYLVDNIKTLNSWSAPQNIRGYRIYSYHIIGNPQTKLVVVSYVRYATIAINVNWLQLLT